MTRGATVGTIRRVAFTVALALGLVGCRSVDVPVPLVTVDRDDPVGCLLTFSVIEVIADPTVGTVDKAGGRVLMWPRGYTARLADGEVEVFDRSGKLVLTTGNRYMVSPVSMDPDEGSVMSGSCVRLCPPGGLGPETFIKCEVGESGPL